MTSDHINTDIGIIAAQERTLVFPQFDLNTAWELGAAMRAQALALPAGLAIEIRIGKQIAFHIATTGSAAINADWVRRKGNTAMHFGRSSYAINLVLQRDGQSLENKYGIGESEYSTQGGGFPVRIGIAAAKHPSSLNSQALPATIGSIAVSGLPQREDHRFVIAAVARYLGIAAPEIAP